MTDTSKAPDECIAPGCMEAIPGTGGIHRRAREAGWSRAYHGKWGTGFRCPDHREFPKAGE